MKTLNTQFIKSLQCEIAGEVRVDPATRWLYSTDASIYQIEPLGVVFPRRLDDLAAIVGLCAQEGVAVLPRGSGSSLAGQAIGEALIVDCSRYLNQLEVIDAHSQEAWVQPGLILAALNKEAGRVGLQFGPDPASAERATMGGSLANNATGAHSIQFGMAADHLLEVEVVLGDGSTAHFGSLAVEDVQKRLGLNKNAHSHLLTGKEIPFSSSLETELYRVALGIREGWGDPIRQHWPKTWRRASGYNLNYLLPWSPSQPPDWDQNAWQAGVGLAYPPVSAGEINLAQLFAGSEGTLGIIKRAKLRLSPLPEHTVLAVLSFRSIAEACDVTPAILERKPSAIELIPGSIFELARALPAYASHLAFFEPFEVNGQAPAAVLVVEFCGESPARLMERAQALQDFGKTLLAISLEEQKKIWSVRKVGLGILMSSPGDTKPWSFIEDLAVPVERLGEFVRAIDEILAQHHTSCEIYAHASAGCLHIRPFLNLKSESGKRDLRRIAEQAVDLTLSLGGSVSGEHGDGLARGEWLERMYGPDLIQAFRMVKQAADPTGILNPGKLLAVSAGGALPRMDENLRYGSSYHTDLAWAPNLNFSRQGGLAGAIEQCNGAGVCRKEDGVMCPTFQATRDEMHSTRGRANLLRALISGKLQGTDWGLPAVKEAMDLCLACKGCKSECPSAVDVAKLRYEFLDWLHRADGGGERRRLRDYLFAYIGDLARIGQPFSQAANLLLQSKATQPVRKLLGIAGQRTLPLFTRRSLSSQAAALWIKSGRLSREKQEAERPVVIFLNDAFSEHFYPGAGLAALRLLQAADVQVLTVGVIGAGRTLISKGFLDGARIHARRLVAVLKELDPQGELPVIGVEPSEIYTLCDEYPDLLTGDAYVERLAERAFTIEEYLIRPFGAGGERLINQLMRVAINPHLEKHQSLHLLKNKTVLFHAHCYQKARKPLADGISSGAQATIEFLSAFGYEVKLVDAGCCGMAGAFGYEAEHYELSMQVGELALFPTVRQAGEDTLIAASGVSCQAQIEDGTGREAVHPLELVVEYLARSQR